MWTLMASKEDRTNSLTMSVSRISSSERGNRSVRMRMESNSKRTSAATGRTTISKARRSTNKTKTSNRMKGTLRTCAIRSNPKSSLMNRVRGNRLGRLWRIMIRWIWRIMRKIANNLKKYQMRMIKERRINRFKSKMINSPLRNSHNNPIKKKRKRNRLKIESSMKELMEGKIINSKIIILFMIRRLMTNKIWDKVRKMLKAQDKGKKVLVNLSILSGRNSFKKS